MSLFNFVIKSANQHSSICRSQGITDWQALVAHVKNLPYGRNSNRKDFALVLKEGRGTCSSKHGLLSHVAQENQVENVKLMMGIFMMNELNMPKIKDVLNNHGLEAIPEAHCYISIDGVNMDITSAKTDVSMNHIMIVKEKEILPDDIHTKKVDWHQKQIREWMINKNLPYTFEEIWQIREECIEALSH